MTSESPDTPQGFNLEISEAIAPTWEKHRDEIEAIAAPAREWMLRELAPAPGDTILELAAGVGDTGFEAAAAIGPSGRLISTDVSPAMLDAARRRGAELGISNVGYRVIDAERIELDDDSVDGVICRYGYMLMPDPAAALTETRRVLRPGGRLVLAVWGPPEQNPFFTAVAMSLVQRGHLPPPDPSGPGLFSMASPERTEDLLTGAGFGDVRTEEIAVQFRSQGVAEYIAFVTDTAGPIAMALRGLSDDERRAVTEQAGAALEPYTGADGRLDIPGLTLCAVAA